VIRFDEKLNLIVVMGFNDKYMVVMGFEDNLMVVMAFDDGI